MRKPALGSIKHKKLFIACSLILIIIAGFFVYKYTYIYMERKKFDKAEAALEKIATALAIQNITPSLTNGCGRIQNVYVSGALYCSNTLEVTGDPKGEAYKSLGGELLKNGFSLDGNSQFRVNIPIDSSQSEGFILTETGQPCTLQYDLVDATSSISSISCGNKVKFKIL